MSNSRLVRAVLLALVGAAIGKALSLIPAPQTEEIFWIANLSSPWPVLAFLAGFLQTSFRPAAIAASSVEVCCVIGFYSGFLTLDPGRLDLPRSTPLLQVATVSGTHWLGFIAPYLLLAIGTGLVYGVSGQWWRRTGSLLPVAMLTLPFVLEPFLWRLRMGFFQGPAIIWILEVCLGLLGFGLMTRFRHRAA